MDKKSKLKVMDGAISAAKMVSVAADFINAKLTIDLARIKAQNYANHTGKTYRIYKYKKDTNGFDGHCIVEPVELKDIWDNDDDLKFVEEIKPNIKVVK